MKIAKLMVFCLLLGTGAATFIGCSDDDTTSKVLLRPVTTMKTDLNHVQLSWKSVEGATEYIVEIYRVTDGANDLYKTLTTSETSLSVDLEWDDSYKIRVKSNGNGRESAYWETDAITLSFPTILSQTKTIDTQAIVTWTPSDDVVLTALTATPISGEGTEVKEYAISAEDYEAGQIRIDGLTPSTTYKINAYSGNETTLENYQGRVMLSTTTAEDFNELGSNLVTLDTNTDENYFNTIDWNTLPEGTVFILPEGKQFNIDGTQALFISHSVTFITPMTLGEYATFILGGAFNIPEGGNVDKIEFKRINIKANSELNDQTKNSLSGKQILCPDKNNSLVTNVLFNDCHIENFRAIVRSKNPSASIENIKFINCSINGIGNQGIISTDGKKGNYVNSLLFDECTITNICGIADLRNDGSGKEINIKNCTFCYAPMDNSFLFRVHTNSPINIENCMFGVSMKVDGSKPLFNQAGSGGQDDYTNSATIKTSNSFHTSDHTSKKGNLGTSNAGMNTDDLFSAPGEHNFKLNSSFSGCTTTGASKWRVM